MWFNWEKKQTNLNVSEFLYFIRFWILHQFLKQIRQGSRARLANLISCPVEVAKSNITSWHKAVRTFPHLGLSLKATRCSATSYWISHIHVRVWKFMSPKLDTGPGHERLVCNQQRRLSLHACPHCRPEHDCRQPPGSQTRVGVNHLLLACPSAFSWK